MRDDIRDTIEGVLLDYGMDARYDEWVTDLIDELVGWVGLAVNR